jgi:ABC-type sugar transport system permease subunit
MRKKLKLSYHAQGKLCGLLFISPFVAGFMFFYMRSIIMSIQFALSEVGLSDSGYTLKPAGLSNIVAAFRKEVQFPQVLASSFGDMAIDIALVIFFSLFMAVLLNAKFRGRGLLRSIFFLPVVLGSSAISGALSNARALLGSPSAENPVLGINISYYMSLLSDLGAPRFAMEYIIGAVSRIAEIASKSGTQIVIFIAALQAISPAIYESARIEGATSYEMFWKITFPMVSPLILANFVYTTVDAYSSSDVVQLSYDTIFGYRSDYAMGTVFSLASIVAVCLFLAVVGGLISRKAFYNS